MSLVAFLSAADLSGVVVFYGLVSSMLWSYNWSCLVFRWLAQRQIHIVLVKLHILQPFRSSAVCSSNLFVYLGL